jgi:hypothetical protein
VKWFLWRGNVYRALAVVEDIESRIESIEGSEEAVEVGEGIRQLHQCQ